MDRSALRFAPEGRAEPLLAFFSPSLRPVLSRFFSLVREPVEEIRLRQHLPLACTAATATVFVGDDGRPVESPAAARRVTREEFEQTLELMTGGSLYALEEELRQGFLTLPGGHRVGLAGRGQVSEGHLLRLAEITSLAVRLAREIPGCASSLLQQLPLAGGLPVSTLVVGPPRSGKTTLLRDLARQVATGGGPRGLQAATVVIVDERSEIAGLAGGRPALDVGPCTDVLDGVPKAKGLLLAVRALGPQVLVTDEVGAPEDVEALLEAGRCGVRVFASAHGEGEEVFTRPALRDLAGGGVFERVAVLSRRRGPATLERVVAVGRAVGRGVRCG